MSRKPKSPREDRGSHDGATAHARRNLRKIGVLFLNFVLLYLLLRLIIELAGRTGRLWIYYVGSLGYGLFAAGLFIAFFVLNGFTVNRESRTWDDLPDDWTDERKRDFLERQPERKERAKTLLYVLLPLVVVFLLNFIELNFFG